MHEILNITKSLAIATIFCAAAVGAAIISIPDNDYKLTCLFAPGQEVPESYKDVCAG